MDMQVIKQLVIHTDQNGAIVDPPRLPANASIEAIFRVVGDTEPSDKARHRRPSPRIAGQGGIFGDLIHPVSEAEDWDANH
ncbi:hypothetical protein CKO31_11985 [Thiohalocapsa halophila]|uniref:Uncharacterized protein n=1 Tax=Thiohalocapsa halophila TaxID=69359 RepID=A0ABS1CHQ3_9GAMM|nr:hypothetical protein [Thiohalocapsa halophila]MBK1631447.1 hypothetical protein [Thiohalocapsa halophila]